MTLRSAFLLLAAVSLAAEERAQISGSIRDASDSVLPNSDVTAVNDDTGIRRSTRSNDNGGKVAEHDDEPSFHHDDYHTFESSWLTRWLERKDEAA